MAGDLPTNLQRLLVMPGAVVSPSRAAILLPGREWSSAIRSAVVWVGEADPCAREARVELANRADHEQNSLRCFLFSWQEVDPDGKGLTASDLLRKLNAEPIRYREVRNALVELIEPKPGELLPNPRATGKGLAKIRGRTMAGLYLDRLENQKKGHIWFVRSRT
jgi:hypothetical protein